MAIPPQPQLINNAPKQDLPPSEARLRILLANAKADPDNAIFVETVQDAIDKYKLPFIIDNGELKDTLTAGEVHLKQFITVDEATLAMKEDARLMAKTNYEVLVVGETGTGKELIAKSMIGSKKGAVKAVNCAGFPKDLIESELFGYVSGAFTGANKTTIGLMQSANDGVMFLDEIGELPMGVQAKLLRALQERRVRKVGSSVEEDISCKFVCATHRNLRQMVLDGLFRQDLYARISTLELDIKPLRERMCDVIPITESLMGGKRFLEKHQDNLTEGRLDLSLNVRSLQQLVVRFNVLGRVSLIK